MAAEAVQILDEDLVVHVRTGCTARKAIDRRASGQRLQDFGGYLRLGRPPRLHREARARLVEGKARGVRDE